jgi:hypothetical protein
MQRNPTKRCTLTRRCLKRRTPNGMANTVCDWAAVVVETQKEEVEIGGAGVEDKVRGPCTPTR